MKITDEMIDAFVSRSSVAPGDMRQCVKAGLEAALSASPAGVKPLKRYEPAGVGETREGELLHQCVGLMETLSEDLPEDDVNSIMMRAMVSKVRTEINTDGVGVETERALYRFLVEGDVIRADDQFMSDDGATWVEPSGWEVGMEYASKLFKSARRLVRASLKGDEQ